MEKIKQMWASVSDRDKKILYVLAMVVVFYLAYQFGYTKLVEKTDEYTQEYRERNAVYSDLSAKNAKLSVYKDDTETYNEEYEEIMASYPAGSSTEELIIYIMKFEEETGLWFSSISLSGESAIYSFGDYSSTNPSDSAYIISSDYVGYQAPITLTYQCSYNQFKEFLDYLNDYQYRYTIDTVSCSYTDTTAAENSDGTGTVTGSMQISQYYVTGSDRTYNDITLPSVRVGTSNIFASDTFESGVGAYDQTEGATILYNYDLYMILSASTSDMDSVLLGIRNDESSLVSTNKNDVVSATITFTGSDGDYRVSYTVDGTTYPDSANDLGASIEVDSAINFLIESSARTLTTDESGVSLTIVNKTDLAINALVVNDDEETPRFNIASTKGIVNIYD